MKVLVLGGNGFIGSHVVDALLEVGHKVRIFDHFDNHYRTRLTGVEYVLGSLDDVFLVTEALADIDVVFHGLSTTVPSTSNLDPIADVRSNLINTLLLLQLMVQKNIPKIVFLSSGGTVYGIPDAVPIPESHPLRPICSYGVVKVAIENYLFMFHQLHGLEYVVLRESNPYGERQGHVGVQGVIGSFMAKILAGEPIEIWGDGSVVRDFIYVGDLAELCVLAIQSKKSGTYNAGSGVGHSINEIVSAFVEVTGQAIAPIYRPGRGYDVPSVVLDIMGAKSTFEWSPKIDLRDGIERSWRWARSQA